MRTMVVAAGMSAALLAAGCATTVGGSAVPGNAPLLPTTTGPAAPTAPGDPSTAPQGTAQPSAPGTAPGTTPGQPGAAQPGATDVLGPLGWGPITIGQDAGSAGATDVFIDAPPPAGSCERWPAVFAWPVEFALVSPTVGVAVIVARTDAPLRTPEGIRVGSSADEVRAVYVDFDAAAAASSNGALVAAHGNPAAAYRIGLDGDRVASLALEAVDQDCHG